MNDLPSLTYTHLAPRGRQTRASSSSPIRQRNTDDLLSTLTPRSAVDAFRNPSGGLKECMDAASPAAQAFAVRAALASKNIQEWLEELASWPWPSGSASAGFEPPASENYEQADDVLYFGSLLASRVAQYEARIDEIVREKEKLDVEEIKNQVLHNHIRPLSRPGSPMLDSSCSVISSLSAFARMDDLTALVTATTIQALPNLSKLDRLLDIWSTRLLVLRRIPVFLDSILDGEIALRSGWNAIKADAGDEDGAANDKALGSSPILTRKAFDVMKSILARKVAKAGQKLDLMLNMLETSEDTLPEKWIDRMDTLERNYGEWTVVCERMVREAEMSKDSSEQLSTAVKGNKPSQQDVGRGSHENDPLVPIPAVPNSTSIKAETQQSIREESTVNGSPQSHDSTPETGAASGNTTPEIKVHYPVEDDKDVAHVRLVDDVSGSPVGQPRRSIEESWKAGQTQVSGALDGSLFDESSVHDDAAIERRSRESSPSLLEALPIDPERGVNGTPPDDIDSEFEFDGDSEPDSPELDLPVLPRHRRDSDISTPSTIVHGSQPGYLGFSSDPPDQGSPELSRLRETAFAGHDISPASTHSAFRSSIRSYAASFHDMPTVTELPDDEAPPKTPSQVVGAEDGQSRDSPIQGKGSSNNTDDQLQQQISEILESVPAKIILTSEPSAVNLNPPDFIRPMARKKSKPDLLPRSHSSLSTVSNRSSRAGTPSFTLAPAFNRNARPRPQRGNQDIKLYHLSGSNGEAPIKLFIRCVGENGERVMVRVGGGWADLGEYLKTFATHHRRRSAATPDNASAIEVKDFSRVLHSRAGSTPPSRPVSVQESYSSPATTPLHVRKTRKPAAAATAPGSLSQDLLAAEEKHLSPETPSSANGKLAAGDSQSSGGSTTRSRSRSSSRLSWTEEDSSLGMAGPRAKQVEMSEESKAWVESVKAKVRIASGEPRRLPSQAESIPGGPTPGSRSASLIDESRFGLGELGKVGSTKRLFRKPG
ncbi:hypothetical protein QBC37DRAFT_153464 [Rhypophila decipiens]|uniref:GAR domain-containing protein n=1 Tax=Rhypophila decipiens TaxID=261697 RepID=A0AAN6YH72_9PEZI|nr:hypothetical protein QBC37DRAFT_153464 [Rhypophila decipiens]